MWRPLDSATARSAVKARSISANSASWETVSIALASESWLGGAERCSPVVRGDGGPAEDVQRRRRWHRDRGLDGAIPRPCPEHLTRYTAIL
jgi:hypothetical protein